MTKEILEGNKLIAKFMGWKTHSKYGDEYLENNDKYRTLPPVYTKINNEGSLDDFKYHSSWDWLMPVVEKIEDLGGKCVVRSHHCKIWFPNYKNSLKVEETKLKSVYKDVVEFIRWYNENR